MKRIIVLMLIFSFVYAKADNLAESMEMAGASVSGYVRDESTGETIIGASVYLEGTRWGSITNKAGYFTITNVPDGKYKLIISSVGYERKTDEINIQNLRNIRKDYSLINGTITTGSISVDALRDVEKRQITISKVNVPIEQIKNIRVGGESDVFRTLQFLPGILTSSQISSGLFVRGGSPDQNLVLLDGSTVYNPSHLFGFISTFNSDAIKDVELMKGGFDAEYGGRLSAVLNITQNDGNRNKYSGLASIGAISSRANIEGPVGNGSFFIGGRRTYFDLLKKAMPEDPENPIPDFHFYDLNGKITQNIGANDVLSLSGFISNDNLEYASYGLTMNLDYGNSLAAMRWTHIFGATLFATTNLSYSKYYNTFSADQSGYKAIIDNAITDYTFKTGFEWFTSDIITTKFGFEASKYEFTYLQNFTGNTDSTQSGTSAGTTNLVVDDWQYAGYLQTKVAFTERASIQAGLRANYWKLSEMLTFDPRISAAYRLNDYMIIKGAWGIFHQNLRLATQPDFTFFDTWLPTDSTVPASKAIHYILSLETNPFPEWDLNFDVYYKKYSNVNELNTNALEGNNVGDVFYIGEADAYGAEVFLQRRFGRFTGWTGYALGFINSKFDSINAGKTFRPKYDRRHDFKLVGQYKLTDRWDVGASFTFQSGQSYTGATSRIQTRLISEEYGRGKIFQSQRNGLRLPNSHQLNLNGAFSFKILKQDSRLIIDIYNVYSRRDIWFRYYDTRGVETQVKDARLIPIIPTASLEVKF